VTRPVALDHAQVLAPPGALDEARRFYGDLVGLEEIERPATMGNEGVWFRVGPQELHVSAESEFVAAHRAHPALRLSNGAALDALAARLEADGIDVKWDDRLPGARRFYASDPWGNRVEFLARE
jgi:catechol 2,3-dioxygenase-like lactoylglutathione lyase family enzyme